MLHSHLPYVLHHGRWPHGSDWLCEAALDTYLPLVEALRRLERDGTPAPVTLGVTAVLANQLVHPDFAAEFEAFVAHRSASLDDVAAEAARTGDATLGALHAFWAARHARLHALWRTLDGDLAGEFRRLQDAGRLELAASAATHAFLPLLARDESIRLQLVLGRREHARLFGRAPVGCWLPECGYRPRGRWSPLPGAPNSGVRRGIEEHLADAGFGYTFTDAHQARAGTPLGASGDPATGPSAYVAHAGADAGVAGVQAPQSPYRAYRISGPRVRHAVAALVRDPHGSRRVWSRTEGYPGDPAYLEFHKQRWPGGARLWRVTAPDADLADKLPYDPVAARLTARHHAGHFAQGLDAIAAERRGDGSVVAVPFDTELFGHWWFEGVDFLADLYAALPRHPRVRPVTASAHLADHPPRVATRLARGSWGRDGDYSMWLNPQVAWTWPIVWEHETHFWDMAPAVLGRPELHDILAQAARALLLLQSSDWTFIMTTGAVEDYAVRRFTAHAGELRTLLDGLREALDGAPVDGARALAATLRARDDLFPDVLAAVEAALDHAPVALRSR